MNNINECLNDVEYKRMEILTSVNGSIRSISDDSSKKYQEELKMLYISTILHTKEEILKSIYDICNTHNIDNSIFDKLLQSSQIYIDTQSNKVYIAYDTCILRDIVINNIT